MSRTTDKTIDELNELYKQTGRPVKYNKRHQFCGLGKQEVWE